MINEVNRKMNVETKKDQLIGCLSALGCELLFGFSYLFTKNATDSAGELALLGWRFAVAFIAICICAGLRLIKLNLKGRSLRPLLAIALFSPVIYFLGETFGISRTTASESGAILACIPVASVVASAAILKKRPTKQQVTGIAVTLTGVLITVFAVGASTSFSVLGYGMLFVGVITYALYSVFVEKAKDYSGGEITFVMLAAGAIVFSVMGLIDAAAKGNLQVYMMLPFTNRDFLIAVLYQGIGCSVLAFFLSNVAIAKIGVNRTASFIGIATVVSIIAGVVLLNESFSKLQALGAAIIICGVYIANARGKKEQTSLLK